MESIVQILASVKVNAKVQTEYHYYHRVSYVVQVKNIVMVTAKTSITVRLNNISMVYHAIVLRAIRK